MPELLIKSEYNQSFEWHRFRPQRRRAMIFMLASDYEPAAQPKPISRLVRGLTDGDRHTRYYSALPVGQDLHDAKVIGNLTARRSFSRTTRHLRRSLPTNSNRFFRKTLSSTSSATTITTSRRPTFLPAIPSSKRNPRSTTELDKLRMSATRRCLSAS